MTAKALTRESVLYGCIALIIWCPQLAYALATGDRLFPFSVRLILSIIAGGCTVESWLLSRAARVQKRREEELEILERTERKPRETATGQGVRFWSAGHFGYRSSEIEDASKTEENP